MPLGIAFAFAFGVARAGRIGVRAKSRHGATPLRTCCNVADASETRLGIKVLHHGSDHVHAHM